MSNELSLISFTILKYMFVHEIHVGSVNIDT